MPIWQQEAKLDKPTFPTLFSAAVLVCVAVTLTPAPAAAQVAGSTVVEVDVTELRQLALGWSAKRQVLGRSVYNDKGELLGTVDDLIVSPGKAVSYIILNAGGALMRHDVAIAVSQFGLVDNRLTLPGTTRDNLAAAPQFQYK